MGKKVVLVTGGTRGIGAAIAQAFNNSGEYSVAVNYGHNHDAAEKFEKETGIKAFSWDVSDFAQCEEGIVALEQHFGTHVSVLVNNAGIIKDAMLHRQSYANWEAVIKTNLDSVFNVSHAVITQMRDNSFGRIINISSVNWHGMLGQTNYSAAKAGIIGFTKALARESANKGITVNAIAPGYTDTDMMRQIPADRLNEIIKTIPVQRLGKPEEIAFAALYFAHANSGFITGAVLEINGGMVM